MPTAIHRRVEKLRRGEDPLFIGKVPSGWVVYGEKQIVQGYCLLLPDPVVPHLNSLEGASRRQFLDDMSKIGDALLVITAAARINYEMLGNLEPALHCHLFPRYDWEPDETRTKPVWQHDWEKAPQAAFDEIAERLSLATQSFDKLR